MITKLLPKFNQVEPSLLPEREGFVVAQVRVDMDKIGYVEYNDVKYIENGILCTFSDEGFIRQYENLDDEKDRVPANHPLFLHFDEELNTILEGNAYFAVEIVDEETITMGDGKYNVGDCIRLIRIVPGCEWLSTTEVDSDGNFSENAGYKAARDAGKIVRDPTATTMPDGSVAFGYRCIA